MGKGMQVLLPVLLLFQAEVIKIIPGVKPTVMSVVKNQLDGVVADGLYIFDIDVFFSGLQDFLSGTMSTDFGRR